MNLTEHPGATDLADIQARLGPQLAAAVAAAVKAAIEAGEAKAVDGRIIYVTMEPEAEHVQILRLPVTAE